MKFLWSYNSDSKNGIALFRDIDGNYYVTVISRGISSTAVVPPGQLDQLRAATLPGFDPDRDNPKAIASKLEPPHPDD